MASKSVCRSCLRALRSQHIERSTLSRSSARTFASSPCRSQEPAAQKTPNVSDMQRHLRGETGGRASPMTTTQRFAERIKKSAPQTAETYHAYGATEHFINAINEIVGYDIPQIKTKEEVPKLEGGEDVGVPIGEGEWYRGVLVLHTLGQVLADIDNRIKPSTYVQQLGTAHDDPPLRSRHKNTMSARSNCEDMVATSDRPLLPRMRRKNGHATLHHGTRSTEQIPQGSVSAMERSAGQLR